MLKLATTPPRRVLLLIVLCSFLLIPMETPSSAGAALDILQKSIATTPYIPHGENHPVDVEYFDAQTITTGIKILWCVFSDRDVDGFRIYRMAEDSSYLCVVNKRGLIPAWQQNYLDDDLIPSTVYRYLLAVVFDDGSEFVTQPVEAKSSKQAMSGLSVSVSDCTAPDSRVRP